MPRRAASGHSRGDAIAEIGGGGADGVGGHARIARGAGLPAPLRRCLAGRWNRGTPPAVETTGSARRPDCPARSRGSRTRPRPAARSGCRGKAQDRLGEDHGGRFYGSFTVAPVRGFVMCRRTLNTRFVSLAGGTADGRSRADSYCGNAMRLNSARHGFYRGFMLRSGLDRQSGKSLDSGFGIAGSGRAPGRHIANNSVLHPACAPLVASRHPRRKGR